MILKFIGIDPGYRNLAITVFMVCNQTKKVTLRSSLHVDLGTCTTDHDVVKAIWGFFSGQPLLKDANYIGIEDQMIGPRSQPRNMGIMYALATIAMTHSPFGTVTFVKPMKKFTEYKEVGLPYSGRSMTRKQRKYNAIFLARTLLIRHDILQTRVFHPTQKRTWEHVADAAGIAFVLMKPHLTET